MTALPTRQTACPPAQRLEAHFAGESMPEVVAHLPGCETCRAYLTELEADRAAFKVRYPTEALVAKHAVARPATRRWWVFGLGFAAATALALGLVWRSRPIDDDVQLKGGAFSVLVQSKDGAPRVVASGASLRAGEALSFRYVVPVDGYLAILDRDERGTSVFVPSGAVKAGGSELVPGSVVLDDALGPEWIVAVFSPQPLDVTALLEALKQRPPSERPSVGCASCEVELLRVEKVR